MSGRFVLALSSRRLPAILGGASGVRGDHHHHGPPMRFPPGTYDEIQIPSGRWEDLHQKRSALYNKFLLCSFIAFTITVAYSIKLMELGKYRLPPRNNTAEGLKFLNPDPEALEYVLKN